MKHLKDIITEKLKISSKSKINKSEPLEPDIIEGPETPGKDYFDEDVIIIGKPFQNKKDTSYKETKEYIRKNGYRIFNDLEDIEDSDMYDWFCYAAHKDDRELNCYVYGPEGVVGYIEK